MHEATPFVVFGALLYFGRGYLAKTHSAAAVIALDAADWVIICALSRTGRAENVLAQ